MESLASVVIEQATVKRLQHCSMMFGAGYSNRGIDLQPESKCYSSVSQLFTAVRTVAEVVHGTSCDSRQRHQISKARNL